MGARRAADTAPRMPYRKLAVEGPQAIALYAFEGANELELSFEADDIIALLGFVDSEWFYVRSGEGSRKGNGRGAKIGC